MAKPISEAQSTSTPSRQLQYISKQLLRGIVKNQPIMPPKQVTTSRIVQKSKFDNLPILCPTLQYTCSEDLAIVKLLI